MSEFDQDFSQLAGVQLVLERLASQPQARENFLAFLANLPAGSLTAGTPEFQVDLWRLLGHAGLLPAASTGLITKENLPNLVQRGLVQVVCRQIALASLVADDEQWLRGLVRLGQQGLVKTDPLLLTQTTSLLLERFTSAADFGAACSGAQVSLLCQLACAAASTAVVNLQTPGAEIAWWDEQLANLMQIARQRKIACSYPLGQVRAALAQRLTQGVATSGLARVSSWEEKLHRRDHCLFCEHLGQIEKLASTGQIHLARQALSRAIALHQHGSPDVLSSWFQQVFAQLDADLQPAAPPQLLPQDDAPPRQKLCPQLGSTAPRLLQQLALAGGEIELVLKIAGKQLRQATAPGGPLDFGELVAQLELLVAAAGAAADCWRHAFSLLVGYTNWFAQCPDTRLVQTWLQLGAQLLVRLPAELDPTTQLDIELPEKFFALAQFSPTAAELTLPPLALRQARRAAGLDPDGHEPLPGWTWVQVQQWFFLWAQRFPEREQPWWQVKAPAAQQVEVPAQLVPAPAPVVAPVGSLFGLWLEQAFLHWEEVLAARGNQQVVLSCWLPPSAVAFACAKKPAVKVPLPAPQLPEVLLQLARSSEPVALQAARFEELVQGQQLTYTPGPASGWPLAGLVAELTQQYWDSLTRQFGELRPVAAAALQDLVAVTPPPSNPQQQLDWQVCHGRLPQPQPTLSAALAEPEPFAAALATLIAQARGENHELALQAAVDVEALGLHTGLQQLQWLGRALKVAVLAQVAPEQATELLLSGLAVIPARPVTQPVRALMLQPVFAGLLVAEQAVQAALGLLTEIAGTQPPQLALAAAEVFLLPGLLATGLWDEASSIATRWQFDVGQPQVTGPIHLSFGLTANVVAAMLAPAAPPAGEQLRLQQGFVALIDLLFAPDQRLLTASGALLATLPVRAELAEVQVAPADEGLRQAALLWQATKKQDW